MHRRSFKNQVFQYEIPAQSKYLVNIVNSLLKKFYKIVVFSFFICYSCREMSLLLSAWQIVIKRSLANWRLLSTVLVGVIVAVALLSSAPLYSNAINDLGLKHTLENRVIELIDLQVYAPNYFVNQEEYAEATALIEQQVSRNIRPVIRQQETWVKSQTFYAYYTDRPTPEGQYQPKGHNRPRHRWSAADKS